MKNKNVSAFTCIYLSEYLNVFIIKHNEMKDIRNQVYCGYNNKQSIHCIA